MQIAELNNPRGWLLEAVMACKRGWMRLHGQHPRCEGSGRLGPATGGSCSLHLCGGRTASVDWKGLDNVTSASIYSRHLRVAVDGMQLRVQALKKQKKVVQGTSERGSRFKLQMCLCG
uniref:Uncharacterized protein n=1 Tax=Physcomitrium patens TaxID=3218 RepID=A0A7I4DFQ4_PHYPA